MCIDALDTSKEVVSQMASIHSLRSLDNDTIQVLNTKKCNRNNIIMNEFLAKDSREFTIRKPSVDDAEEIINYSKQLFESTDQVLTLLEEYTITVDNEIKWIENLNDNPNSLLLIAEMDNKVIGLLFFIPNTKKKILHTGEFGVSVHPAYQGQRIGQLLVETLLEWAKQNVQIEKVFLQVFATNANAIKLYKTLGFIEEGRHIKAIKQVDGTYVDIIQMYIETM
jgi:RimJ/RimL family protein N-acetyltransferase